MCVKADQTFVSSAAAQHQMLQMMPALRTSRSASSSKNVSRVSTRWSDGCLA